MDIPLPPSSGYSSKRTNAAHLKNTGYEVQIDAKAIQGKAFNWDISATWSKNKSEVTGLYGAVPGGVVRETDHLVLKPDHLVAELQALPLEVLCVGNGAILYRHEIEELGSRVEFASTTVAHPDAAALVELAVPRLLREDYDRPFDIVPLYLRKSDAEIASGSASKRRLGSR